jgi:hypothetical protein
MIERILAHMLAHPEAAARLPELANGRGLSSVLIGSRWERRTTWAVFAAGSPAPAVVIKADHNDAYKPRLQAEHAALTALSRRPELAGTVPEPVALLPFGNALVLAQRGLAGVPLSVRARQRLRSSPRRSAREHNLVMGWLTRLQGPGRPDAGAPIDGAMVSARVQQALRGTDGREAFVRDVRAMAAAWPDLVLPVLPGHGDLGPSNCLLDGAAVRVFDWEGGVGDRTPLADLVVFLNHYARAQPSATTGCPARQRLSGQPSWTTAGSRVSRLAPTSANWGASACRPRRRSTC